ncbi:hypothetical protein IFU12_21690 [Pseudomonas coleopterorum]|nr:hypothetical protein [Pseudomonas coleopterorum]
MFPEKKLNVVQLALTLPAPAVAGVVNGRLDAADIPAEGVKITAAYTGQAVGQWVSAHWVGVTAALSQDFPAVQVTNASTALEFTVPKVKAEASLFKAVSVVYKVARTQGAEAKASEALPLEVERPKGGYEDFEGFAIGSVSKVELDGMTITHSRGTLGIVNDHVGGGISGSSLSTRGGTNGYPGLYFRFHQSVQKFELAISGTRNGPTTTIYYEDGTHEARTYLEGRNAYTSNLDGAKITLIYVLNTSVNNTPLVVDDLLWSV